MNILPERYQISGNASIISMIQRLFDIVVVSSSLYIVYLINNIQYDLAFGVLILFALVVFQMIGGITDFYRSWRGNKLSLELLMIIKNWTLSLIILFLISNVYPIPNAEHFVFYQWYVIVCVGFIFFRCFIRYGIGVLRNLGYNRRTVAMVGAMPSGIALFKSFQEQTWLGFVVKGIYDDENTDDLQGYHMLAI
ncbi:UDP-glucose lipid carrier transferase [Klebsiella pneumoniae]|nr:UDP-glucose lipid carrier transferase [Klebsiella pneumoniae]